MLPDLAILGFDSQHSRFFSEEKLLRLLRLIIDAGSNKHWLVASK